MFTFEFWFGLGLVFIFLYAIRIDVFSRKISNMVFKTQDIQTVKLQKLLIMFFFFLAAIMSIFASSKNFELTKENFLGVFLLAGIASCIAAIVLSINLKSWL